MTEYKSLSYSKKPYNYLEITGEISPFDIDIKNDFFHVSLNVRQQILIKKSDDIKLKYELKEQPTKLEKISLSKVYKKNSVSVNKQNI